MKSQTVTIKWHPLTETPKKEGRYLFAEVIHYINPRTMQLAERIEINERRWGRKRFWYMHGIGYAWAEKPTIEPPKPPKMEAA